MKFIIEVLFSQECLNRSLYYSANTGETSKETLPWIQIYDEEKNKARQSTKCKIYCRRAYRIISFCSRYVENCCDTKVQLTILLKYKTRLLKMTSDVWCWLSIVILIDAEHLFTGILNTIKVFWITLFIFYLYLISNFIFVVKIVIYLYFL